MRTIRGVVMNKENKVNKENKANKKTKEEIASIFEQIAISEEFSEIVNFDLNNEVYNPNFNTQQVTLDNSTEVINLLESKNVE